MEHNKTDRTFYYNKNTFSYENKAISPISEASTRKLHRKEHVSDERDRPVNHKG